MISGYEKWIFRLREFYFAYGRVANNKREENNTSTDQSSVLLKRICFTLHIDWALKIVRVLKSPHREFRNKPSPKTTEEAEHLGWGACGSSFPNDRANLKI